MINNDFIHLHCHNEFSLLDGFGSAEKFADKIKGNSQLGMALTNHGNVDGAMKFQNAFQAAGLIPIHGAELYIVKDINNKEKGDVRRHIVTLVKNEIGWKNLLKMLTIANLEGFYYRPRISPKILLENCEGLIITTACASSFLHDEWGKKLFKDLNDAIGNDLYAEIMPHNIEGQEDTNKLAISFAEKFNRKIIATNDCHYIGKDDEKVQEVLLAIQSKKKWKDPNRWRFEAHELYLKTREEMLLAFANQGCYKRKFIENTLDNTIEIFDKCKDFRIPKVKVELPTIPELSCGNITSAQFIKKLCRIGIKNKIMSDPDKAKDIDKYIDRMNEELETIEKQGFIEYFLIVWEVINWCKLNDIMTGPGRGSAAGSLVCYLLNITKVDPIKFNLLFARFISPARIDLPDIDNDFQDNKRHLVVEHFQKIYGEYFVAGVSTFLTMKGKGALRDVARVFDVPLSDVNSACASIVTRSWGDFRSSFTIEDAFDTFEDGKKFKEKYPKVTDIAIKIEGQTRGKGQHAAAVCISSNDLRNGTRCNLLYGSKIQSNGQKDLLVNWDKHDIESFGLMKLDILGLNALTVLSESKNLIKKNHGVDVDYESIKLDDKDVLQEFSKGNTTGIFQFNSLGLKKLCYELGIDDFKMLSHANALYRPGTLKSGMVDVFVARKRGLEKYKSAHPIIEKLTKDTFGIILYQEQVMLFMYDLAGLGWKTADSVRKVVSKSQGEEQFKKFKEIFVNGCLNKKTLPREEAEKLWDDLSTFGTFAFNLSHSVAYSVISFWEMWLKVHYPNEFICASLTFGNDNKKSSLVEEAIRLGLDVRPPKLGKSHSSLWIAKDNILYAPFIEIKGIGEATAIKLAGEGKRAHSGGFFELEEACHDENFGRFGNILDDIKAGCDESISDEEAVKIKKYFNFSLCKNPLSRYDSIMDVIKKGIKISRIKDVNWSERDYRYNYYFGEITQIKYSYKSNLDSNNTGGVYGGVYGNLKDKEGYSMIIFEPDLYNRRKEEVEHCSGEFSIVSCNHPKKATHIECRDIWFGKDMMSGNLEGLNLKLARKVEPIIELPLDTCSLCPLKEECTNPVQPSLGKYNMMIVGEAPGKDEDALGEGFIGKSGRLLWDSLKEKGYRRNMFHITNVVKCFPSSTKTPTKRHIKSCSKYLDKEIEIIKPFIILAFGNTSLKYFTDEDSGIMSKNGTTEWNEKANAWICWCMHPASVLYHEENRTMFDEGIKNFANKIRTLGGLEE